MFEIPRLHRLRESEVSGPSSTSSYAPPSHCTHPPTLLEPFILLLPAASWNLSESSPLRRRRHLVRKGTKAAWQPCETGFLPSDPRVSPECLEERRGGARNRWRAEPAVAAGVLRRRPPIDLKPADEGHVGPRSKVLIRAARKFLQPLSFTRQQRQ